MLKTPLQQYQQSFVQTSSPSQLLIMLYDGAIRFTKLGIEGIEKKNYEQANTNLIKAQSVINELVASLKQEYPIAKDLTRIYEYMLHQLLQANIMKNAAPAQEVLSYLDELRATWKEAIKLSAAGPEGMARHAT